MEILRFGNQGFLENEENVTDEPTFTHIVEGGEVVVNNLNGDAAQSQEVSTNHPTNSDSGNMDDRNESTSHSVELNSTDQEVERLIHSIIQFVKPFIRFVYINHWRPHTHVNTYITVPTPPRKKMYRRSIAHGPCLCKKPYQVWHPHHARKVWIEKKFISNPEYEKACIRVATEKLFNDLEIGLEEMKLAMDAEVGEDMKREAFDKKLVAYVKMENLGKKPKLS
ncbi:hypothetical protein ACET3Z_010497 [Daucus carota]